MRKVWLFLAVGILVVSVLAQAEEMKNGNIAGMRQKRIGAKVLQALDLSDEERQNLAELREKNKGEIRKLHSELRKKRNELKAILESGDFSEDKAFAIVNEINELQRQILRKRVEHAVELRNAIGPDKYEKFIKIRDKIKERRRGRRKVRGVNRQRNNKWQEKRSENVIE